MNEPTEYPYKPKIGGLVMGGLVFGGIAIAWARLALINDRGLILNGIFHFGITGANVFYWILAAACGGLAALCVLGLASSVMAKSGSVLRLTATGLQIPHGFLKRIHEVPFSEMAQVKLHLISGQRFLVIQHGQKKVTIIQSALPDNAAWEQVCKIITERTRKRAR